MSIYTLTRKEMEFTLQYDNNLYTYTDINKLIAKLYTLHNVPYIIVKNILENDGPYLVNYIITYLDDFRKKRL